MLLVRAARHIAPHVRWMSGAGPKSTSAPKSACPPGVVLNGLKIYKNQDAPVTKQDEDYPEWLWKVLDTEEPRVNLGEPLPENPAKATETMQAARAARKRERTRAIRGKNALSQV